MLWDCHCLAKLPEAFYDRHGDLRKCIEVTTAYRLPGYRHLALRKARGHARSDALHLAFGHLRSGDVVTSHVGKSLMRSTSLPLHGLIP